MSLIGIVLWSVVACQKEESRFHQNTKRAADLVILANDKAEGGDFDGALETLSEAETLYRDNNAPHLQAEVLEKAADVCFDKSDFGCVEQKLIAAKAIYANTAGERSPQYTRVLISLGNAYGVGSQFEKAERSYQQALSNLEEKPRENPEQLISLLCAMGDLKEEQHRCDEAMIFYEKLLQIAKKRYPNRDLRLGQALDRVAECLVSLGHQDAAATAYTQVLAIYKQHFDVTEHGHARVLNNAGVVLLDAGKYMPALEALTMALDVNKKRYGMVHVSVAANLHNIGSALLSLKRYQASLEALETSYAVKTQIYDGDQADKANTLSRLGDAYLAAGNKERALDALERSLAMYTRLGLGDTTSAERLDIDIAALKKPKRTKRRPSKKRP